MSSPEQAPSHRAARAALGLTALAAITILGGRAHADALCSARLSIYTNHFRDKETGLFWEKGSRPAGSWTNANNTCADLGGGYRLPTVLELSTLIDDANGGFAPGIGKPGAAYWSSQLSVKGTAQTPDKYFFVGSSGSVNHDSKGVPHAYRCVKKG